MTRKGIAGQNPLVTVFIPMFNAEKYIGECIESILAQTYSHFEIVIVDDGSTDSSISIVKAFNDTRIRIYSNEKNRGIPYTRNRGLDLAKGKYMAVMDADDVAAPERLEVSVRFLEKHPESRIVGSMCDYIEQGKIKKVPGQIRRYECQNYCALFRSPINNSSAMIDLEFVRSHGIRYREECFVAQDYDFFVQCLPYTKIIRLREKLILYRISSGNITNVSIREKKHKRDLIVRKIQKKAYENLDIDVAEDEVDFILDCLRVDDNPLTEADYFKWLELINRVLAQVPAEARDSFKRTVQRRVVEMFAGMPVTWRKRWKYWKMAGQLHGNLYSWIVYARLLRG